MFKNAINFNNYVSPEVKRNKIIVTRDGKIK